MAQERLPMRKIREILRLRWCLGYGVRQTATSIGVSTGAVSRTTTRAVATGLDWEAAEALSEVDLEQRLYGRAVAPGTARAEPDPAWMESELRRPGMTLELLHLEYLAEHPSGLRYTAFCDRYRRWKRRHRLRIIDEFGSEATATGRRHAREGVLVAPATGWHDVQLRPLRRHLLLRGTTLARSRDLRSRRRPRDGFPGQQDLKTLLLTKCRFAPEGTIRFSGSWDQGMVQ
jgi:hypothetical protein